MGIADSIRADRETPVLSVEADLEKFLTKVSEHEIKHGCGRAIGWHPSQLFDLCPRFEVFKQLQPVGKRRDCTKPIDSRMRVIFNTGTALHEWWQEQYFGPMGVLKGTWICRSCGMKYPDQTMPKMMCPECYPQDPEASQVLNLLPGDNRFYRFGEVAINDQEWGIVGHSDGIYILGKGTSQEEEVVLEIKTAGPSFWTRNARPYPANIFQINLYMWVLKKKRGVLLYVDKGGASRRKTLCREVIVDYNDTHRKDVCDKIGAYRDAVKNKKLPPRLAVCELTPRARKPSGCPFGKACVSEIESCKLEKAWGEVAYL